MGGQATGGYRDVHQGDSQQSSPVATARTFWEFQQESCHQAGGIGRLCQLPGAIEEGGEAQSCPGTIHRELRFASGL